MNKFDKRYEIRIANKSDIEDIMNFIDKYWNEGHILAHDENLFRYEFEDEDQVNFILAIDKKTKFIEGIFGFIKCSNTDDSKKKDVWGSMWKVNDEHENMPLLGVELAKRVFPLTGCRTHIGNGANPKKTVPLRKLFFGDKVVKMKQYYLLNPFMNDYEIALIQNQVDQNLAFTQNETTLREFQTIREVKKNFNVEKVNAIPYKDNWYINKRYFNHPYYKYEVYGLEDSSGDVDALMMTREVKQNNKKVLRIVDYIGEHKLFAGLYPFFYRLMKINNYEYVDFYTYGFDEKYILKAGFKLRTEDDPNIIPNYFEPFMRENIDIWAHYQIEGTLFFLADGDQDRPNEIREE